MLSLDGGCLVLGLLVQPAVLPSLRDGGFHPQGTQGCASLALGYFRFSLREKGARLEFVISHPCAMKPRKDGAPGDPASFHAALTGRGVF